MNNYHLLIEIPDLPLLPNRLQRSHWRAIQTHTKKWHILVYRQAARGIPLEPLQRAELVLTRHSATEPDPDNLMASWKPLIDGLQRVGILVNDKRENVELDARWVKCKIGKGKVTIEITELPSLVQAPSGTSGS